jgi:hypothetical protein
MPVRVKSIAVSHVATRVSNSNFPRTVWAVKRKKQKNREIARLERSTGLYEDFLEERKKRLVEQPLSKSAA